MRNKNNWYSVLLDQRPAVNTVAFDRVFFATLNFPDAVIAKYISFQFYQVVTGVKYRPWSGLLRLTDSAYLTYATPFVTPLNAGTIVVDPTREIILSNYSESNPSYQIPKNIYFRMQNVTLSFYAESAFTAGSILRLKIDFKTIPTNYEQNTINNSRSRSNPIVDLGDILSLRSDRRHKTI
jgi:hypothetical protein